MLQREGSTDSEMASDANGPTPLVLWNGMLASRLQSGVIVGLADSGWWAIKVKYLGEIRELLGVQTETVSR